MKEKDFQQEIHRSVRHLAEKCAMPVSYTKIPDAPRGPEQRFSARKGYDCFLVVGGRHIALELKLTKAMSISFAALDDYQEDKLLEVDQAGGKAFLLINFRVKYSEKEARRRGRKTDLLAFALPIREWIRLRQEVFDFRDSVPLHYLEECACRLERVRTELGGAWDLSPIVEVATCAR